MSISIYTDGSAKGNPGKGGYGIVLISKKHRKEISQGFEKTTNNRMELLAVIVALEQIKKSNAVVTVYSDSKYVVDAIEKGWVFSWVKIYKKHVVNFVWVKGHSNNKENNRCDALAVAAAESKNLQKDLWYEKQSNNDPMLF